jgi:hypothetical protein
VCVCVCLCAYCAPLCLAQARLQHLDSLFQAPTDAELAAMMTVDGQFADDDDALEEDEDEDEAAA